MFDKYYDKTDESPLYASALILHPNCRAKYIRANWKPKWQRPVLKKVKDLWISYRDGQNGNFPSPPRISKERRDDYLDEYDRAAKNLRRYIRPPTQDEFDDYSNGEPCDIGKASALEWWCQEPQQDRWPKLSLMAIDILSIPAMSAEPERVFSGARRTISWERAQMGATNLERVECLKHWQRSGIIDQ